MTHYEVTLVVTVTVDMDNPDDVIGRVVENRDNWRGSFYPLHTRNDVLEHLAYNYVLNGVTDASRLDGWADLAQETCKMDGLAATLDDESSIVEVGGPAHERL